MREVRQSEVFLHAEHRGFEQVRRERSHNVVLMFPFHIFALTGVTAGEQGR